MEARLVYESFRMSLQALAANRMRSLLALLGIVIGVATVIGMVALVNGFQRSVEQSIRSMGTNTIYIHRIRPSVSFGDNDIPDSLRQRKAFSVEDGKAIVAGAPAVRAVATMMFDYVGLRLGYRGKLTRGTNVQGTDENYLVVHGFEIARGRDLNPQDVARRSNVVVLGPSATEKLFGNRNPLGQTVRVGSIPFTVIGEYAPKGKMLGQDLDNSACMPYTTMTKYFAPPPTAPPWVPRRGEVFLHAVAVSPDRNEEAQQQIIDIMRVRRHLPSNKPNNFAVFTDESIVALVNSITGGIVLVMVLISGVSLLVGGIGVMNIMLVAVTERTHEIGIRKAVGARSSAILAQFLIEAILLTAAGGALGVAIGWAIAAVVKAATPLSTYVSPWSVIVGLVFSAAVGLFFGAYPAMRAARLDPVESLRYE
ncbi:MAG TPA: ABC transporter permease [Terriglobales bacterium]|nr:ABC transporter permease [Terriglobales bacterium]